MADWEIRETKGRTQPFTLWHHGTGDKSCPVGKAHVHKFAADIETCEEHVRDEEHRYAFLRGEAAEQRS